MLANNYSRQGDFAKALKLIKDAYTSYKLYYGEFHTKTAFALQTMGKIYFFNGLDEGEGLIKKALKILESKNNTKTFSTLEVISDIEFNKAKKYSNNGNETKANYHYRLAQEYMDQSLRAAMKNLPSNSEKILHLKSRIIKLTSGKNFNN